MGTLNVKGLKLTSIKKEIFIPLALLHCKSYLLHTLKM